MMVYHPFLAVLSGSTLSLESEIATRLNTVEEIGMGGWVDEWMGGWVDI
jgi:hypothetical protein